MKGIRRKRKDKSKHCKLMYGCHRTISEIRGGKKGKNGLILE
jgi:hypothetical protein